MIFLLITEMFMLLNFPLYQCRCSIPRQLQCRTESLIYEKHEEKTRFTERSEHKLQVHLHFTCISTLTFITSAGTSTVHGLSHSLTCPEL